MLDALLMILASYLWGSVPSAYLVARYRKGIDIRRYGSGNVGASNIMIHVGKWTGFFLGTFDCLAKGTLPVIAANLMDMSLAIQVSAGLVSLIGHNWSPYIGFTGGRGVATAIGIVFGMAMWHEFLILAVVMGAIGRLIFHDTGIWTLVAALALPLLAKAFERPPEILFMALAITLLLILKRLTSNWTRPSSKYPLVKVMMYRALWDRDVPKKIQWTERNSI